MARSVRLELTTSASARLRSIRLSYERAMGHRPGIIVGLVPKVGFEPTRPEGHCALNAARLPFRHFGT